MRKAVKMGIVAGAICFSAQVRADEAAALQRLLEENQKIIKETEAAKKREEEIGKAKLELDGVDAVLKRAEASFRRNVSGLQQEAEMFGQAAERTKNNGCPWGGKAEISYANSCNSEMAKIRGWAQELQGKQNGMAEYAQRLRDERDELSRNVTSWGIKKSKLNGDFQRIEQRRREMDEVMNSFVFRSQTYERLKQMAPIAQTCAGASGGSAQASDCLRRLWEGR